MNQMRKLRQAAAEIKAADPNTAISYNTLLKWVKSGKLPHVNAGNRYLIDMDVLNNIMKGGVSDANS